MTRNEYAQYEQAVAEFIAGENIKHLSTGDGENSEPWFSWHPCQCCKSHFGGNREHLHTVDAAGGHVEFTICEDCVYYVEYGRLDDTTMLEIEATA